MRGKLFLIVLFIVMATIQMAWAQLSITSSGKVGIGTDTPYQYSKLEVKYDGANSLTKIIRAEYTGSGNYNAIGVYGMCEPNPNYGYGGYFRGGKYGVYAIAYTSGNGDRYGLYARAYNGNSTNYGVYAWGTQYGIKALGSTYAGYFAGDLVYTGDCYQVSDVNLKENVKQLENVLPKLVKLSAKTYYYKSIPEYEQMNLAKGMQYGFIAQELEEIFPELVGTLVHHFDTENDNGDIMEKDPITFKGISYTQLIPILVQAVQEQQKMIEELRNEIDRLK